MLSTQFLLQQTKWINENFENAAREAEMVSAYNKIFRVIDTNNYDSIYTSTEGASLPTYLTESETPNNFTLWEGYKVTLSSQEFGQNLIVPYKVRLLKNDSSVVFDEVVKEQLDQLVISAKYFIEKETHKMLNNGFSTVLAPDGLSLFNNAHAFNSWVTFDNLLAASALDLSVIDEVERIWWAFVDGNENEFPIVFDTIIVKRGSKAAEAAKRIFGLNRGQYQPTSIANVNIYEWEYKIIETPYITSNTAYFFTSSNTPWMTNPLHVEFVDRPGIKSMIEKENLDVVYPCAGSFKYGVVNMPMNWLGSAWA